MKVLVTGVLGFIAASLLTSVEFEKYDLYGLDISEKSPENLKGYYQVDISKPFQIEEEFDVVIHLAAFNRTNVDADFGYEVFDKINVQGTVNVAKSCKYKKFIFLSSTTVYSQSVHEADEDARTEPVGNYAVSKYNAEQILKEIIPEEKLAIIRTVNILGPQQKAIAVVPVFFQKALKNEPIKVFVPANKNMQFLSVNDLICAFDLLIVTGKSGVFNLAPEGTIEIQELARNIITLCHSESELLLENKESAEKFRINAKKAREELNWKPKEDIDSVLLQYYKYFSDRMGM